VGGLRSIDYPDNHRQRSSNRRGSRSAGRLQLSVVEKTGAGHSQTQSLPNGPVHYSGITISLDYLSGFVKT
jgi:hypothetical protein